MIKFILILLTGQFVFAAETADTFKWNGDLRYRHEWIQSEGASPTAYNQHRIILRVGALAKIHPTADAEVRITTGTGRTTETQTLGSGFANNGISIDRAYFHWRPVTGLSLYGGRVKNIFFAPRASDLLWDGDLNFDGLAMNYALDSELKPFVTASLYWVNKVTTAENMDNHLLSLQTGIGPSWNSTSLRAGVAVHHYTNMTTQTAIDPSNFKGNTATGTGASATYQHHFTVLNPGMELGFAFLGLPFTFTADMAYNPATDTENTGFLVGLAAGDARKQGDWRLSYDYRVVKADSTVAAFTDGDSFSGGTDGRGHRGRVNYRVLDPLQVVTTVFVGERGISGTAVGRDRVQVDLWWTF